ncbi:MAG: sigma factor-like helix-turn-helix DNA-binding protein, partial [Candidatus Wallbacteria bacterium]|nr:sigma factor-like helix-turn-helix DNA-binding protein [Candidatus Wallbacteria bacterium]
SPVHLYEKFLKIRKFCEQYFAVNQQFPDNRVISEQTGISIKKVNRINGYFDKVLSLESFHTAPDHGGHATEDTAVNNSYQQTLSRVVADALVDLTEKEREIIKSYFGLEDVQPKTLRELSSIYRLTKERIRQIKNFALEKLAKSNLLTPFEDVE